MQLPGAAPGRPPRDPVLRPVPGVHGTADNAVLDPREAEGARTDDNQALARELVMDRTTLGRTMLPLERDGLIAIKHGILDHRSKELAVTKAGTERLQRAAKLWVEAQKEFEERFGARRAADLRGLLGEVVSCELDKPASGSTRQRQQTRARL